MCGREKMEERNAEEGRRWSGRARILGSCRTRVIVTLTRHILILDVTS